MKLQELIIHQRISINNNIEKNTARLSVLGIDVDFIKLLMELFINCEDIDLVLLLGFDRRSMSYEFEVEYTN